MASRIRSLRDAWQAGTMPPADAVLLPLCVGLTLLGVILTGVAWRRGNKGRVMQGAAAALAPIALYFSGLLRLLWNGVVAIGSWAAKVILSPAVWIGLSLLGLCVVLWVVGGLVAKRSPSVKAKKAKSPSLASSRADQKSLPAQTSTRSARKGSAPADPVDDEMAEIEALLKSRGIE